VSRVKSVAVPSGTVYDIDVDPTNKYMITSGQVRETDAICWKQKPSVRGKLRT
jgi:hypothetical protein